MLTAVYIIGGFAILSLRWRFGFVPAALSVGLSVLIYGTWQYLVARRGLKLSQATAEGTYHDTYYVISHGWWIAALGLTLMLLVVAIKADKTFGSRTRPVLSETLFWILVMAFLTQISAGTIFRTFILPRRYTDMPDAFAALHTITTASAVAAFLCFWLLAVTIGYSILMRLFKSRT